MKWDVVTAEQMSHIGFLIIQINTGTETEKPHNWSLSFRSLYLLAMIMYHTLLFWNYIWHFVFDMNSLAWHQIYLIWWDVIQKTTINSISRIWENNCCQCQSKVSELQIVLQFSSDIVAFAFCNLCRYQRVHTYFFCVIDLHK